MPLYLWVPPLMNILVQDSDIFIMQMSFHPRCSKWVWCFGRNSYFHDTVSVFLNLGHHQQDTVCFSSAYTVPLLSHLFRAPVCLILHNDAMGSDSYVLMFPPSSVLFCVRQMMREEKQGGTTDAVVETALWLTKRNTDINTFEKLKNA